MPAIDTEEQQHGNKALLSGISIPHGFYDFLRQGYMGNY
jgi:hypothetical protein